MENPMEQLWTTGVVIPAFNEAKNILSVINTLYAIDWLQEIILVEIGRASCRERV